MADDRGAYKLEIMKVSEPREPMGGGDWKVIKFLTVAAEVIALPAVGFVADVLSGGSTPEAIGVAVGAEIAGLVLAAITLRWGAAKDAQDSEGYGLWTNK